MLVDFYPVFFVRMIHTITLTATNSKISGQNYSYSKIPWFPGMRVLDAMILADSMSDENFTFRANYNSDFGVLIDVINGVENDPDGGYFWMLYLNGTESSFGASEAIIIEDHNDSTHFAIEWSFESVADSPQHPMKKTLSRFYPNAANGWY